MENTDDIFYGSVLAGLSFSKPLLLRTTGMVGLCSIVAKGLQTLHDYQLFNDHRTFSDPSSTILYSIFFAEVTSRTES